MKNAVAAANDSSKKVAEAFETREAKNNAKEEEQKKLREDILKNINNNINGN